MTIFRYLAKEIYTIVLPVLLVLLLLVICNQLVRYLGFAAIGKISGGLVLRAMMYQLPILVAILLPLALYLGTIIAYSKLWMDGELTVLASCGMSNGRLLGLTLVHGLFIAMISGLIMCVVGPKLNLAQDQAFAKYFASSIFETILPGRFEQAPDGKHIYYVAKTSPDHRTMQDIFVAAIEPAKTSDKTADVNSPPNWAVLSAGSAKQEIDQKTRVHYLVMNEGARFQGQPGSAAYKIVKFKQYGLQLGQTTVQNNEAEEVVPTLTLWHEDKNNGPYAAEFQWRVAMPISALLLVLLAIPLSRVNPRHGKYIQILPAILIYIIYANMLFMARSWIAQKQLAPWLGMWVVHLGLLVIAGILWITPHIKRHFQKRQRTKRFEKVA